MLRPLGAGSRQCAVLALPARDPERLGLANLATLMLRNHLTSRCRMTRGLKSHNQHTERQQGVLARASFRGSRFQSIAAVAELITQKGSERLKLRNRSVQQVPGCNHHCRLSF